jgi:hypothetical protein
MKRVGDLFEKYRKTLKAPQGSVEKVAIEVVGSVTGFKLKPEQVTYTVATRTLHLKIPGLLKSEIKFHHQAILTIMREKLGEQACPLIIL